MSNSTIGYAPKGYAKSSAPFETTLFSQREKKFYTRKSVRESRRPQTPLFEDDPSQREPDKHFHTKASLIEALNKFYGETRYSRRPQTVLYKDDPPQRKTGVHTRDSVGESRVPIGGRRQSRRQLRRPKTPKRKTRRH
jgi:hypothetical protein